MYWVRCLALGTRLTALEDLDVNVELNGDNQAIVPYLFTLLEACGPEMINLTLSIIIKAAFATEIPPVAPHGIGKHWEALDQLHLAGIAIRCIASILPSLHCKRLSVDLVYAEDWHILRNTLGDGHAGLPDLTCMTLSVSVNKISSWPNLAIDYPAVGTGAKSRGIRMDVSLHTEKPVASAFDIIACLRIMGGEVVGFFCVTYTTPIQHIAANIDTTPINLPRCHTFELGVLEPVQWHDGTDHAVRVQSVVVLLPFLSLPEISTMDLNMSTRCSGYLPAIAAALTEGAFPRLESITGRFGGGTFRSLYGSDYRFWERRKRAVVDACSLRGVRLDGLEWCFGLDLRG